MIYGVVLAGGIGARMGNVDKPKQFLTIGGKPIIVHTVEKFMMNSRIDRIMVLCPAKWVTYTREVLKKCIDGQKEIVILQGGETRNGTILNAIKYIEEEYKDDDAVMITHDAVRPFVTHRIIEENIDFALKGIPCDTVIPASDTIVESINGSSISLIPDRSHYYQGQTPQSFRLSDFKKAYECLSEDDRAHLTDAAKVFVLGGFDVALVKGETFNIKITYPYDLQLAEILLVGGNK